MADEKKRREIKGAIEHIDRRIDNARASATIGRQTPEDTARTNRLIADLEAEKKALAPAKPSKSVSPKRQAAIDAYKQKFGHVPPSRMPISAMQRWTSGSWSAAPGKTGDPAYEKAVSKSKAAALSTQARQFKAPDPAKVIAKRNETARSLAEQTKATGVNNGRGAAARDLVRRNQSDLSRTTVDAGSSRVSRDGMMWREGTGWITRERADQLLAQDRAKMRPIATNDSHMGTTTGSDRTAYEAEQRGRESARTAYNQGGGRDPRGRMFEALSGQPRVTKDPGRLARAGEFLSNNAGRINTALTVTAAGVAAAQGYARARGEGKTQGEAAFEAAKSGAVPAALAVAQPVGRSLSTFGTHAIAVGAEMLESGTNITFFNWATDWVVAKTGLGAMAIGGVAKVAGAGLKVAGRVAAPAIAGYQAFQGYKADGVRGAVKGAITAFDPTELATIAGAKQGAAGWAFDKAFGAKDGTAARANLSAPAAKQFSQAQASYGGDQTTNYVEEFSRTYTTGAKAGVTETVRNWKRS